MPKVAHISDIHFGPTFDIETWKNVRSLIEAFDPNLIIVSGDLVDHPSPFRLLAVKCELQSLCQSCKSRPELFVVPGNHDVKEWGNFSILRRKKWFERIMFNDTSEAEKNIQSILGLELGLNATSRSLTRWQKLKKAADPRLWIRWNVKKDKCDGQLQSCDYRRGGTQWPIESQCSQTLVTCFDSNPSGGSLLDFATGEVESGQVTRLLRKRKPSGAKACASCQAPEPAGNAILLSLAVLHHHPLPIALASDSKDFVTAEGRRESFLVLRNSGDLLYCLQRRKCDLILHGHKHRPQFARVELNSQRLESYPLVVLAGGSTAKRNEKAADNTLRLIDTEPNGRLIIRTLENGEPDVDAPYRESIALLKERAFARAVERAGRVCRELRCKTKIDAVGNLWSTERVYDLQASSGDEEIGGIPLRVAIPPYGQQFEDRVQPESFCRDRITLHWRDSGGKIHHLGAVPPDPGGCCWIQFNEPLKLGSHQRLSYGVRSAATNSIAMTTWELEERIRVDAIKPAHPHYEAIWRYVGYPAGRLVLQLRMPSELERITPEVRCRRHKNYPEFPLTFRPDQQPIRYDAPDFDVDEEV